MSKLTEIDFLWTERPSPTEPMAIDIETTGVDPLTDKIVGVGFADSRGSVYVSTKHDECKPGLIEYILRHLAKEGVPLLAHNMFFDRSFLGQVPLGAPELQLNWLACTFATYKLAATEGWFNQSWSLKTAQVELLGWKETNEKNLDNWLIDNGYAKSVKKEPAKGYYRRDKWIVAGKPCLRYVSPDKAQMSNAPSHILGGYCCLDAESTYLLWQEVLLPVLSSFPALDSYVRGPFNRLIGHLIRQKLNGINVDMEGLLSHKATLESQIEEAKQLVFERPEVEAFASERRNMALRDKFEKAPAQYRKFSLPREPKRLTARGVATSAWLKWKHDLETKTPDVSKNWLTWVRQYEALLQAPLSEFFNMGSGVQLTELIYNRLKYPVELTTDKGAPAVDKRAMGLWGDLGKALRRPSDLQKELSYVESAIEHARTDNLGGYRIHPGFRVPGTLTGRLAGAGGINFQQVPKSEGYLSCYRPPEGRAWVDVDFTSLENIVLAELSRDPTLWKLYGPGRPKQDAYLFNGANLRGTIRERLRAHGYNPDAPTPEAISITKKKEKMWRTVAKVFTLSANYGAGPRKIHETLRLSGIQLTLEEVYDLHKAFWELYAGIKDWEKELFRQWRANGGWLLNGIGRPIGVHADFTKDLVNRVCQSTGHDILVFWVDIWSKMLDERGIKWEPIMIDFHDESLVECDKADAEEVAQILRVDSFNELNKQLGGKIALTGDGGEVASLWEAKAG